VWLLVDGKHDILGFGCPELRMSRLEVEQDGLWEDGPWVIPLT